MANSEHLAQLHHGPGAWEQWRDGLYPVVPDLSGADLSNRDLRGFDLSGANLEKTALHTSMLWNAKLVGSNLREADLSGCDFTLADMDRADLSGAILNHAVFENTVADRINLTAAQFGHTHVCATRFHDAIGLDDTRHRDRSFVDSRTLYMLQRPIPLRFLRGCGVPESLIEYLPSLLARANLIDFYSCFISYSSPDRAFARRLHDALQGRGIRCWMDEHQLLPGDDLKDEIDKGIRLWDKLLLCCSKASLSSWWVDKEIDKGIEKEEHIWKKRQDKTLVIIPLNLDGYLLDGWGNGKASMIRNRLAADFTGWERDNAKFEEQLDRLARALRADEGGRERPPPSRL